MFKKLFIKTIIIFILSSILHFGFDLLPNNITAIILPVNESIWEHMKLIFTAYMCYLLIKYAFFKVEKKEVIKTVSTSLLNIISFLIIYLPIYHLFGEHLIVTLILYFMSIFLSLYILERIDKIYCFKIDNKYSLLIILFIYLVFGILTFIPPKNYLFYDPIKKIYGINYLNK